MDKGAVAIGGRSMGERVIDAVRQAERVVVVGEPCPGATVVTREDPPGGGPVAAIAAGLGHVRSPHVLLLAVDLPFVRTGTVTALLDELTTQRDAAGVVPTDPSGRDQLLCSAWRTNALRRALEALGDANGASVRALVAAAGHVRRIQLSGDPPPFFDCDTPADVVEARRMAEDVRR